MMQQTMRQVRLPGFEMTNAVLPRVVRAVVRSFSIEGHTATVQPLGSPATYAQDVPVSLEIASLAAGERVLVLLLDEHNHGDAVIICRYGGEDGQ